MKFEDHWLSITKKLICGGDK